MEKSFGGLLTLPKFIEHKIASAETKSVSAIMYEYLMAAGGLFIRAKRSEFTACLPHSEQTIKNLPDVKAGIFWHKPKISPIIWRQILEYSRANCDADNFREDVFVVYWNESAGSWFWKPVSRERRMAATIAEDRFNEYATACLELHTHPPGAIYFSSADDRDEMGKFRIFGILVDIHTATPKIRFRCGIYDYFTQIPSDWVGEMPGEIVDLNEVDRRIKKILL